MSSTFIRSTGQATGRRPTSVSDPGPYFEIIADFATPFAGLQMYWCLGCFSTDTAANARSGGLFRSFETMGQAISYGSAFEDLPADLHAKTFAHAMPLCLAQSTRRLATSLSPFTSTRCCSSLRSPARLSSFGWYVIFRRFLPLFSDSHALSLSQIPDIPAEIDEVEIEHPAAAAAVAPPVV